MFPARATTSNTHWPDRVIAAHGKHGELVYYYAWLGVGLLTLSIGTGIFFLQDMFDQRLVHHGTDVDVMDGLRRVSYGSSFVWLAWCYWRALEPRRLCAFGARLLG